LLHDVQCVMRRRRRRTMERAPSAPSIAAMPLLEGRPPGTEQPQPSSVVPPPPPVVVGLDVPVSRGASVGAVTSDFGASDGVPSAGASLTVVSPRFASVMGAPMSARTSGVVVASRPASTVVPPSVVPPSVHVPELLVMAPNGVLVMLVNVDPPNE